MRRRLVAALAAWALVPFAPRAAPAAEPPARLAVPGDGRLYHGVYPGGPSGAEDDITPEGLSEYERLVGRRAAWVYFSDNWSRGREFPSATARWIRDRGSVPFIRLMLRSSAEEKKRERVFTLDAIRAGRFDADLRRWSDGARAYGGPLLVEWGTEVNGEWFPWNARWNPPDGARKFKEVFRRLVRLSREQGALNISWVFHADARDEPTEDWNRLERYYPGDDVVDWIAVSAYGPQSPSDAEAEPLRSKLDAVYPRLRELAPSKPILLAEFGCTNDSPAVSQPDWARAALQDVLSGRWPRIKGFSWWNERWENDDDRRHDTSMRLQDSDALARAFRETLAARPDGIEERPLFDGPAGRASAESEGRVGRLKRARTWMYQLQDLDEGAVAALAASEYPLLVVEPGQNLKEDPRDARRLVERLRRTPSGGDRLVLAYVDIGQAESYRNYWAADWKAPGAGRPGRPDFLLAIDPDGWKENYPVAYWRKSWQDLWLEERGIVKTLARAGFDGIYLDWVEAYDDEHVEGAAAREHRDAAKEMIDFVAALRSAGRSVTPDLLVVAQNAPYLLDADPDRYAAVVDALAVEDTWFHGAGDASWDDPRAGDLHERHEGEWSTEARLEQYRKYSTRGLPVFSVDYCVKKRNAELVYRLARQAGLRPLVTRVSLSRMTPTPP